VSGNEICIADSTVGSPNDGVVVGGNVADDVLNGVNGEAIDGFVENDNTGKLVPRCADRSPDLEYTFFFFF
jgi:hypothetical protein